MSSFRSNSILRIWQAAPEEMAKESLCPPANIPSALPQLLSASAQSLCAVGMALLIFVVVPYRWFIGSSDESRLLVCFWVSWKSMRYQGSQSGLRRQLRTERGLEQRQEWQLEVDGRAKTARQPRNLLCKGWEQGWNQVVELSRH